MTFRQQSIAQMRSQKTSGAGHDGNGLVLCGHCAVYLMSAAQICQHEVMANDEMRFVYVKRYNRRSVRKGAGRRHSSLVIRHLD